MNKARSAVRKERLRFCDHLHSSVDILIYGMGGVCAILIDKLRSYRTAQQIIALGRYQFIVPTPLLVGGGTIYSTGFFWSDNLADRYNHRRVVSGIIRKPVQRRIWN